MSRIGRCARLFNYYKDEVAFSNENGFGLMQIWYDKNGIGFQKEQEPKHMVLKNLDFPSIIHALLDINEFEEHVPKLIEIAKEINHKEIIIHPVCKSEPINEGTLSKLVNKVGFALDMFRKNDMELYLENNSKLDPIFTSTDEIKFVFEKLPDLKFLLDIAHVDDYTHLKEMVEAKKPELLHIADRRFNVVHEHLPIGEGNIDFEYIFGKILNDFKGRVIIELIHEDSLIVNTKNKLEKILNKE